jgi:hypothetical protein
LELKDLKDLLKLLRAQGVLRFKTPDLELELSEFAPQQKEKKQSMELDEKELTDEELIFYSALSPVEQLEPQ